MNRLAAALENPGLSQLFVLCRKWFPGRPIDVECMAEAAFLEHDHWRKMGNAVARGIAIAFGKAE